MKVLMLTGEIPYPPTTGARLRTYNLIQSLAGTNKITLLTMMPSARLEVGLPRMKELEVEVINVDRKTPSRISFYTGIFRNLLSTRPFIVDKHQYVPYINKVLATTMGKQFDLVHCDSLSLAPSCDEIRSLPTVLTAHNMEATIWQRYYEEETNPFKKYYIKLQYDKVFQFEKEMCEQFSEVIAVSEEDKERLEKNYGAQRVSVVANGVDTEYFSSAGSKDEIPESIVFTGSMDWRPNQDAVIYFSQKVWPLIKKFRPGASFWIIGRKPSVQIRALQKADARIHVTGMVDDVRPYIERGTVYAVPLRIGGGSRLKILEALGMKKAVVSTTIGAEGLNVTDREDIILADAPEDMSEKILALFDDVNLREELGNAGRRLVLGEYDWSIVAREQGRVWNDVTCRWHE